MTQEQKKLRLIEKICDGTLVAFQEAPPIQTIDFIRAREKQMQQSLKTILQVIRQEDTLISLIEAQDDTENAQ